MSPNHLTDPIPIKETVHIIKQYLFPADTNCIRCVDEREAKNAKNNGAAIPGGTNGIIDTIKFLNHVDEDAAWQLAIDAGIPMGGHIDEHHKALGCGYERLVEQKPESVGAVESIPAQQRKARIENAHGEILTLLGDHHPTEAIINYRAGTTIDTRKATGDGRGIFDLDIWAMPGYAEKLGIDPDAFTSHMLDVYKKTVTTLTEITEFIELS